MEIIKYIPVLICTLIRNFSRKTSFLLGTMVYCKLQRTKVIEPEHDLTGLRQLFSEVEMWWLISSAPDFWGRGPGLESGISHNDPEALQDHCEQCRKISG